MICVKKSPFELGDVAELVFALLAQSTEFNP